MILDADILIDLARGHPAATAWLSSVPVLPAVCGFAAMELIAGCLNSVELASAWKLLTPFLIVWPSESDMHRALTAYIPLRLSYGMGVLDALIAATATGRGETLATFNTKHFRAIPGLITEQPYIR